MGDRAHAAIPAGIPAGFWTALSTPGLSVGVFHGFNPLFAAPGKRNLLVVTASLLAVAVAARYTIELLPVALAVVPALLTLLALLALLGAVSRTFTDPEPADPAPSLRSLLSSGAVTLVVSAGALALPVALLLSSVRSFAGLDLESGATVPFLLSSTTAFVAFLAVTYALPALLASALRTGRVRDAVEGVRNPATLLQPPYFLAWTIGFPLVVVAWGLALLALVSTEIGGLLAAVLAAYVLLVGVRVLGSGYESLPGTG